MIVKNLSEFQFTKSKPAPPPKPYFLQGLEYARQMLVQLRKQKQHELQYSPISRKHTKFSSDVIIEQQSQRPRSKDKEQAGKNRPRGHKKIKTQSYDENDTIMQTTKVKFNSNSSMVEQKQTLQQKMAEHPLHQEVAGLETKINEVGQCLQQINDEIETYEVIFENLCQCYRANQHIYNRNQKLRRQAIRLEQEKADIVGKIEVLNVESEELDHYERKANENISKSVKDYVSQLCSFNLDINIGTFVNSYLGNEELQDENEQEQQEKYQQNLNLNYKKLKEKYDDRIKKKVLLEPKKLQKGVSFEQQIDVISKYYESQLTNI